jgi:hypothetical protein
MKEKLSIFIVVLGLNSMAKSESFQGLISDLESRRDLMHTNRSICENDKSIYLLFEPKSPKQEACDTYNFYTNRPFKVRFRIDKLEDNTKFMIGVFLRTAISIKCDKESYCEATIDAKTLSSTFEGNLISTLKTQIPDQIQTAEETANSFIKGYKTIPGAYMDYGSLSYEWVRHKIRACDITYKAHENQLIAGSQHREIDIDLGVPFENFITMAQKASVSHNSYVYAKLHSVSASTTIIDSKGKVDATGKGTRAKGRRRSSESYLEAICHPTIKVESKFSDPKEDYLIVDSTIAIAETKNEVEFTPEAEKCFADYANQAKNQKRAIAVNVATIPKSYRVYDEEGVLIQSSLSRRDISRLSKKVSRGTCYNHSNTETEIQIDQEGEQLK